MTEYHPSSPWLRLLCALGQHSWTIGKYVTYCSRCYAQRR